LAVQNCSLRKNSDIILTFGSAWTASTELRVRDISVGGDAFGFCEDVNRAYVIR